MNKICQSYMPSFYRSYKDKAVEKVKEILPMVAKFFDGVYLIALWQDGGADNGFDVVDYVVNQKFGTDDQFKELISEAHRLGLTVGVDVVPNHTSDKSALARNCLEGRAGYKDCLYVVSEDEAARLTKAGVPSFFGQKAYSPFGTKFVRSTFADYHQLNLNWESKVVQEYFRDLFERLRKDGVDFCRIDCGMMLLEDVSKADPKNKMACMRPRESVDAICAVAGDMPLFFEWFDPTSIEIFDERQNCWALDCSYIMTGELDIDWASKTPSKKLVPLVGGHDQMTLADRKIPALAAINKMADYEYGFLDIQTLIGWTTKPELMPSDLGYDADPKNPNQRYRARRPIGQVLKAFNKML